MADRRDGKTRRQWVQSSLLEVGRETEYREIEGDR